MTLGLSRDAFPDAAAHVPKREPAHPGVEARLIGFLLECIEERHWRPICRLGGAASQPSSGLLGRSPWGGQPRACEGQSRGAEGLAGRSAQSGPRSATSAAAWWPTIPLQGSQTLPCLAPQGPVEGKVCHICSGMVGPCVSREGKDARHCVLRRKHTHRVEKTNVLCLVCIIDGQIDPLIRTVDLLSIRCPNYKRMNR